MAERMNVILTVVPAALQKRLKRAALRDRDLDLEIAHDWFAADQKLGEQAERQRARGRNEVKSISRRPAGKL